MRIDNISIDEVFEKTKNFLRDGRQHYIVTVNPDFLVKARRNAEFREILNRADLNVADGFGLILASRFLGRPLKERVAGVDLMERILNWGDRENQGNMGAEEIRIFLLGGWNGAAEKIAEKYPGVVGVSEELADAGKKVNLCQPHILFVALGAPRQERWIAENLARVPTVKVAMGVGSAFDILSGQCLRAPRFVRRIGLEWFWRLFGEPWRIGKVWRSVVVFGALVIKDRVVGRGS